MKIPLSVLCGFICVHLCIAAKLPATFKKCKASDKECLSAAVEDALKQLKDPLKAAGLPSLEPLEIPELTIGAGTSAVNLVQNYKNVKLYGFSKPQNTKFEIDLETKTAHLEAMFEEVKFIGEYDINGRILLLPVYGQGPVTMIMKNLFGSDDFKLEEYEKKGKKYLKVVEGKLFLKPGHVTFNLENLFNGDKSLGDNVNKVLNENWEEVYRDVESGYEEAFGKIVITLYNSLLSRVPIDEMFEQ